jgi:hypothetical protein
MYVTHTFAISRWHCNKVPVGSRMATAMEWQFCVDSSGDPNLQQPCALSEFNTFWDKVEINTKRPSGCGLLFAAAKHFRYGATITWATGQSLHWQV